MYMPPIFAKFLKLKKCACDITIFPEFCVSVLNSDKFLSLNTAFVDNSAPNLNFLKLPIETW
jgi:predicted amidohydrolase